MIEHDQDGFFASCPELKGCHSQGSTFDEALLNIEEAIDLHLETLPPGERESIDSAPVGPS